jgi:hypothetical protein
MRIGNFAESTESAAKKRRAGVDPWACIDRLPTVHEARRLSW